MGAKSAVKLRNRGIAFKCDICGRKLMSADALVAHQRTAHNIITKRRGKYKQVPKPINAPKMQVKPEQEMKSRTQSEPVKPKKHIEMKKNMVEFECPKCFKRFPTYFPALKHIQKYHCVDKQNVNVEPNHPSLIQPVRVELCLKCDQKVKSIQTHICDNVEKEGTDNKLFICSACDESLPNLKALDTHVLSLHGDNVESMFFPTSIEYTKWKTEMEQQTNTSYAVLDNYESKKYYHCNYVKGNQNNSFPMQFCPSTIVTQEFSKGIQVHFYKQHYKHESIDYKLSNKYKKYSITSFMRRSDDYNSLIHVKSDENDLYVQFKTLMEGIIVDAAKINITTLKIILGKALEITSIITNYDEENDDNMSVVRANEVMTDSQIAQALEEPLAKRKNSEKSLTDVKRPKLEDDEPDMSSPKIVNSFSLAELEGTKNSVNDKEKIEPSKDTIEAVKGKIENKDDQAKKAVKNINGDDTPSSFNDSYRDFVVRNFPTMEGVSSRTRSKPVVKTRMGQFKPSLSPKKAEVGIQPPKTSVKIDDKPKIIDSAKDIAKPKLTNKVQPITKAATTPKAQPVSKISRVSFDKPKVDFEYEVKEQEDDCNILILKL